MSRLTRDGTAESISLEEILRRELRQENIHFPCSADHEQDWNLIRLIYTLLYVMTIHTYINTSSDLRFEEETFVGGSRIIVDTIVRVAGQQLVKQRNKKMTVSQYFAVPPIYSDFCCSS